MTAAGRLKRAAPRCATLGRMTITLQPMTEAEFAAYQADQVPDYAQQKVRSGQWPAAEALALAQREVAGLLPQGLATPDHRLFTLRDDDGQLVGWLWVAEQPRADGARCAYVYDVVIRPERRREGWATQAFTALEAHARVRGLAAIGLHVFGHNHGARALYEQLGFVATSVVMSKPLDGA